MTLVQKAKKLQLKLIVQESLVSGYHNYQILYSSTQCLWVFCTKLASCHHSGALNFEVGPRFLENLYTLS